VAKKPRGKTDPEGAVTPRASLATKRKFGNLGLIAGRTPREIDIIESLEVSEIALWMNVSLSQKLPLSLGIY
jgi:hypothetical protein